MIPRLKELYNKEIKLSLKDKYNFKNLNMAPEVEKIVINMGLGIDGNDAKIVKACEEDLSKIEIDFNLRPDQLSLEDYISLAKISIKNG